MRGTSALRYASAHHFEGYISEVSLWQRSLDAAEVKSLANSNPLNSKTLSKDLIGYWCIYQRADLSAPVRSNNPSPENLDRGAAGGVGGARLRAMAWRSSFHPRTTPP